MNDYDRKRLDALDQAIRTLNREMGIVQGCLEGIEKRVGDIRWMMGGTLLAVLAGAIKVIFFG